MNCLLHRQQRDAVAIFDVNLLAGDDRIGVGVSAADLVLGELLELLAVGRERDHFAARRQGEECVACSDDRSVTAAAAHHSHAAALAFAAAEAALLVTKTAFLIAELLFAFAAFFVRHLALSAARRTGKLLAPRCLAIG